MRDIHKTVQTLNRCLVAGSLVALTGCAQLALPKSSPGGLLQDPANETQSALATLAAATSPGLASPTPRPASPTSLPPTQPASTATSGAIEMCSATDLLINLRSDITGNAMVFTAALTNAGNRTCSLPQPPNASLITKQGARLDVDSAPDCAQCIPLALLGQNAATRTALVPTQTAQAEAPGGGQIRLSANQTATLILRWTNWCNPLPPGGISIRLDLGHQTHVDLATDAQKAGTCTAAGQPSSLAISPFVISP